MRAQKMDESMLYLHNPSELSHSLLSSKNPSKRRRCRVNSSEASVSMGKTNRAKQQHKCSKLDKCTTRTESDKEDLKQHAIVCDCEIEVQELGEGPETATSRRKRSRCKYSLENANALEKSAHLESLHSPLGVNDGSLKPRSAAELASSKSIECDSSASNSEDPKSDQVSEPSRERKKLKLIGELESHNNQRTFTVKDHKRGGIDIQTEEFLEFGAEKLHEPSFASSFLDPLYVDNQDLMEIVLVNVELSVHASPRAESAPFVSLRSEAYDIAILGYPLDVGEIRDASETLLLPEEKGDRGSRFNPLIWKASKRTRTPVCYVTTSLSASTTKNARAKQLNRVKTTVDDTCVPVELIFSKILAAVH